jgi:hypothetical protein
MSIFLEVILSVILREKLYMYICPILNGFQDTAISLYELYCTLYAPATYGPLHVSFNGAVGIATGYGVDD